jgi:hypothetical protein
MYRRFWDVNRLKAAVRFLGLRIPLCLFGSLW